MWYFVQLVQLAVTSGPTSAPQTSGLPDEEVDDEVVLVVDDEEVVDPMPPPQTLVRGTHTLMSWSVAELIGVQARSAEHACPLEQSGAQ